MASSSVQEMICSLLTYKEKIPEDNFYVDLHEPKNKQIKIFQENIT